MTATMLGKMQTTGVVQLRQLGQLSVGNWEQINYLIYAFLGNDGFISSPMLCKTYRRFLPMHRWADSIARFVLTCETRCETLMWDETSGLAQTHLCGPIDHRDTTSNLLSSLDENQVP